MSKLPEFRDENTGRFEKKNSPLMVTIAAKVTPEERDMIIACAEWEELSVSEFIRQMIIQNIGGHIKKPIL
jgi:uncharacterized protein (DUF1778 family)